VLRDGKWTTVKARYLVPVDIIRIRDGDFVPADVKLLKGEELEIDQSTLTGRHFLFPRKQVIKYILGQL